MLLTVIRIVRIGNVLVLFLHEYIVQFGDLSISLPLSYW